MKRSLKYFAAAVFVVALLVRGSGLGQVPQSPDFKITMKAPKKLLKAFTPQQLRDLLVPNLFDSGHANFSGISNAAYDLKTGEIWITAMKTSIPMDSYAAAVGYQTSTIQNTGSAPWKGITATATFQVFSLSGVNYAEKVFCAAAVSTEISYEPRLVLIKQEGTIAVTSAPLDVPPNGSFFGMAYLKVLPGLNKSTGVYAKLVSLKLNI